MILAEDDPLRILYRSEVPVLKLERETERFGVVDNVVFPKAIDDRGGGRIDVYYGMADARIGAALHSPSYNRPRVLFPREPAASMGAT